MSNTQTLTQEQTIETSQQHAGTGPKIRDYLELCKIKVVALLVLTALVGLALAPDETRRRRTSTIPEP